MRPSFLANIFSGILILISFIILFKYNFTDVYKNMILLLAFSIALGIHGIQHSIEEIYYDFNPLANKWKVRDDIVNK
jgi:glycopeptide antibiotics resistance protein